MINGNAKVKTSNSRFASPHVFMVIRTFFLGSLYATRKVKNKTKYDAPITTMLIKIIIHLFLVNTLGFF